ncbi:MAG: NAD-dependent epimerase/dehydratase family protein [Cyanobacteriota bacterium]|nr:NAD-dependent epimerase/dehydratase family protein [Cyanobacteriota bacterium]
MEILSLSTLPDKINNETELEELLSRPTVELIEDLSKLDGDIIVLGASGQIGPSLARMAKRAAPNKRIIAVSRFRNSTVRERLESWEIETITCDLLDHNAVEQLPKLPNVIYMVSKKFGHMVGLQFGAEGEQPLMWATNTYVPAVVAQSFCQSRIVAFSASAVYPLAPVTSEGFDESAVTEPVGEYANSCVGRERIFQFFSQKFGTPGRTIRLNYAISLNYSILFDTACRVRDGKRIPLSTGYANVIWQGDAIAHILRSLLHCTVPSTPLNIGGVSLVSVRDLAHEFSKRLGKTPIFEGEEEPIDWVNSTAQAQYLFGDPIVPVSKMIDWVADWVQNSSGFTPI